MESNNRKRLVGMLAAGLVGVLVGALATGFVASASEGAEGGVVERHKGDYDPDRNHDPKGLSVVLNFKQQGKGLELKDCDAKELEGDWTECAEDTTTNRTAKFTAGVAIVWDPDNSGCTIVGGVQYCW